MSDRRKILFTLLVASLGYFVDIYDLVLFSIVRVPSLRGLGTPESEILSTGVWLLNAQMAGMLVGGVLWGVLGDKRGRLSVLFGSILLYSLANLGNALVTSVPAYTLLRFLAGVGLAGELGAAITLISEIMPKETRGWGATLVATVGVSGAVFAAWVGDTLSWQAAYVMGGCLGLFLLLLRVQLSDSGMFEHMAADAHVKRGDFIALFTHRERFQRYLCCILVGVPIWYVIGILITFSPELSRALAVTGPIKGGQSIKYCYIGLIFGDFASGFLSQYFQSRRKILGIFLFLTTSFVIAYGTLRGISPMAFYGLCTALGFATGYWAVFVTVASEQFGTNLRATVTTTAPNFVRGAVVPVTLAFQAGVGLIRAAGWAGTSDPLAMLWSAMVVGAVTLVIAAVALFGLKETFGKDLNYLENLS